MKTRRTALLIVTAFSLLLVILLGLGTLDLGLYKSEMATNRTGISTLETPPDDAQSPMSFELTILYDGEVAASSSHLAAGMPTLPLEVNLIPEVTGNVWVPFYKTFEVAFSVSFEGASSDGLYVYEGDLNGTTKATITGLCSQRKALELAQDDIVKTVQAYFKNQLIDGN